MALSRRSLIISCLAWISLCAGVTTGLRAQASRTDDPPVMFRAVCVNVYGTIGDLFYDLKTEQIPFLAGDGTLGPSYRCPSSGVVALYRQLPPVPPETKPRKDYVADIRLGPGGPWLVVVNKDPKSGKIQTMAVDENWSAHAAGTIRIFNFCHDPVALRAGSTEARLGISESTTIPYPADNQLWLKVAVSLADGNWEARCSSPQRIIPGTRATWILLDRPPTLESPDKRIVVRNLVEPAPPSN